MGTLNVVFLGTLLVCSVATIWFFPLFAALVLIGVAVWVTRPSAEWMHLELPPFPAGLGAAAKIATRLGVLLSIVPGTALVAEMGSHVHWDLPDLADRLAPWAPFFAAGWCVLFVTLLVIAAWRSRGLDWRTGEPSADVGRNGNRSDDAT